MKQTRTKIVWVLLLLCGLPSLVFAQEISSKVKIFVPKDRDQRAQVCGLLQIDHYQGTSDGAIVTEIDERMMNRLKSTPYRYQVLVPDVAKRLDSLNQIFYAQRANPNQSRVAFEQPGGTLASILPTPTAFQVKGTFGGYYNFAEITAAIGALFDAYPGIVDTFSLGRTAGGRDIWCVKISDNPLVDETNEPEVLFMGLQHAREAITGSSMIFTMQYLAQRYSQDARIKNLVDNREIFIVPCFNPDGWEYNRTSKSGAAGGTWRKNRRSNAGGSFGVDLNRNWGVDWGNCGTPISGPPASCGTNDPTQETYYGTAAFSELETEAVRKFTKSHHIVIGFDQHAFGPYYSLPFGRQALHSMGTKAQNFYTTIPALMGKYNGMRAADSYSALGYEVAGGFKDWMLMGELGSSIAGGLKDTVWAMTGEGGAADGTTSDFWAPAAKIEELSKGMCYQNIQLLYAAGTYVDIQDNNDIALTTTSGTMNFTMKRIGIGNLPVTVSLVPLENIADVDDPVTVNSMGYYADYNGGITFSLPAGITTGMRIKYAWKITADGQTYSDTVVRFYNPTTLLSDNMEGTFTTNWTNKASAESITSGFGYNYTAGNWVFTASGGYGGSGKALSESAVNVRYAATTQSVAECNTSFNLTGSTSAYLTFMVRHLSENWRDKVMVQVSDNGGTSWTALSGKYTVRENITYDDSKMNGKPAFTGIRDNWVRETIDLSAYNSATALKLRFVFQSDNDLSTFEMATDEGFFIDNVKVMKSNAPLLVLPVKIMSVRAIAQGDNTIKVEWDAVVDGEHDHFEVERADDRTNFTTVGIGPNQPPYEFLDLQPRDGFNYYRIKAVDKNGEVVYSKIVGAWIHIPRLVSVYPNPMSGTERVFVGLKNMSRDVIKVELTDLQGRTCYSLSKAVDENTTQLSLDIRNLAAQSYILKVTDSKGVVLGTEKLVKL